MTNPTPTNWRALCAELEHAAQELELAENALLCSSFHNSAIRVKAAARRARAALAQPEPQGPTDEELLDLFGVVTPVRYVKVYKRELDFARAVLARWGRPAIEPVPQQEAE